TEPTAAEEPTEPTAAEEPTEPTAAEEPTEPTAAEEPTEPTAEEGTVLQEAEQKSSQVATGGIDIDEQLEEYLDKTRDERVDRDLCSHAPYRGVWNYDTKECEIDDPDQRNEYEKERTEMSRYDQALCPNYGGIWNDEEKTCEIEDLEEKTAYEDTLCDEPADTILYCGPRFAQTPLEKVEQYDKSVCINVGGRWNEETSLCETENEDTQKYLNERQDIYSCITSGREWNYQENKCAAALAGDIEQKVDQEIYQKAKVEEGTSIQQAEQEASQVAPPGAEELEQKVDQEIIQEAEVDEGKVQQVARQISEQLPAGTDSAKALDLLNLELKNRPEGQVSQALETLTGMIASGDANQSTISQTAQIINTQIAQGKDITQIFAPTIIQIAGDKFKDIVIGDINRYDDDGNYRYYDDERDHKDRHYYHTEKIIKYKTTKCLTQASSIPLTGKIGPKTPVLLGDFYPCELKDGRATLNLPDNPDLQFMFLHVDKYGDEYEGVTVPLERMQSLSKDNALFVVQFDDDMDGQDPITGEYQNVEDINVIALYNQGKQTIDFKLGNSLAVSALLKS
ncbi:MAG: hypothetical protein WCB31_10305, partial [Nitrososphaeraceae archaeon]